MKELEAMNSRSKVPKAAVLAVKSTTHPPGDGWISLRFGDEVSKKGVGSEKTQADVCGLGELPQGVRESKIFCTWSTIYQGHHNLKGSPDTHIEEKKSPFIEDSPGAPSQVASGKEPACQCRRHKRCKFNPGVGMIPWRRAWQPTPGFLPGESHGQRSLVSYSPQRVRHDWSDLAHTQLKLQNSWFLWVIRCFKTWALGFCKSFPFTNHLL